MSEQIENDTSLQKETQQPLIMNKYKNIDEVVEAHKSLQSQHTKLIEENKKIKQEYQLPEDYHIPTQYHDIDESLISKVKEDSKNINLTQKQFEKILENKVNSYNNEKNRVDSLKEKYGEDHYEKVMSYIKEDLGFTDNEIKHFTDDRIEKFNVQREKYFNTSTPTMSSHHHETKDQKSTRLYKEYIKLRNNGHPDSEKAFQAYISSKYE